MESDLDLLFMAVSKSQLKVVAKLSENRIASFLGLEKLGFLKSDPLCLHQLSARHCATPLLTSHMAVGKMSLRTIFALCAHV